MTALKCPICGSTIWTREEERVVQDDAWIDTASMTFFDFEDEETVETKALTPWHCSFQHDAPDDVSAALDEIR